ncbi:MAG: hypothetical protein EON58_09200 [Alphaproteobacteria bacterium]|nr:MAG: hypothetical protein EON58_09200 [Alphaproteobacteria bacterium]
MTEVDTRREATASIRGYFYQLDATLLEVLSDTEDKVFKIEGIEDIDSYSDTTIEYSQVKYYEGQSLTPSVLREPLFKLFHHYLGLQPAERAIRKYKLYGHFKDVKVDIAPLSTEGFKQTMAYEERPKEDGKTVRIKKSMLDGLAVDDDLIGTFCGLFNFQESKQFDAQKNNVITHVRKLASVGALEAEGLHYPRLLKIVSDLAVEKDHEKRVITKTSLIDSFRQSRVIFDRWLLREKGDDSYARDIRRLHFTSLNAAGVVRVFAIAVNIAEDPDALADIMIIIAKKWSSSKMKRIPEKDRYAPYLLFRGASIATVEAAKRRAFAQGLIFVDGYPFKGAEFDLTSIRTDQTESTPIAMRVLESVDHLEEVLGSRSRKQHVVYDFFAESPMDLDTDARTISIPITNLGMILKII